MIDCNTRQESLKAYLDGEVSLSQRLALRLHLFRCESCRKEISEMQRISVQIKKSDSPLPSALRDRILNSVSYQEVKPSVKVAMPAFRMKPVLAWGGAVASLLIAVGLGSKFLLSPQYKSDSASPTQNTQTTAAPTAASPVMNGAFEKRLMKKGRSANKLENSPTIKPTEDFSDKKGSAYSLASPAVKSATTDSNEGKSIRALQDRSNAKPESENATFQSPLRMRSTRQGVDSIKAERRLQSSASVQKTKQGMEDQKHEATTITPFPSSVPEKTSKQAEISGGVPVDASNSKAFNTSDMSARPIIKNRLDSVPSGSGKKSNSVKRVAKKRKSHKSGRAVHKKNN